MRVSRRSGSDVPCPARSRADGRRQSRPQSPPPPSPPHAKPAAAKPAPPKGIYDAMPVAERIAIQSDLVWTGDLNSTANGEWGPLSLAAVKAFQKRKGGKDTGILTPEERAALAADAKAKQADVGWRLVTDDKRRAARHAGQAGAAIRQGQERRPLAIRARRSADRRVSRNRAGDARRRLRHHAQGSHPQGRIQRAAAGLLRARRVCRA